MRIVQLDLKAFGHFTDRRICFESGAGFHIAYGPNEAGKTTLSRALKAALFGIPERTGDNHTHANPNLRVGVVLESSTGDQLAAMRRKARKNSLVKYNPLTGEELGEVIADDLLKVWMGGLSEGLYTSMFGLDHDELVAGGRALSEGRGELGQSLFEASAGLSSVRALRERLTKEADELFRPRASTSVIYQALGQYSEARKEAKEAQIKPAEWESLRKLAEEAKSAYDGAREQQDVFQREARRLERLAAVLPDVASRLLAQERITLLGEVTKLPSDAPVQRVAAETRLQEANTARNLVADNLIRLQNELDAISLPQSLLQESGAIEAIYYSLDAFRSARETLARAKGQISLADTRVNSILSEIGESDKDNLRTIIPGATLRARVQSQITKGTKLQAEMDAVLQLVKTTKIELDDLNQEIGELDLQNVPAAVVDILTTLDAQGNPELKATELNQQAAKLQAALDREASSLNGGTVENIVAMGTPMPAELQRFRNLTDDLASRRKSLKDKIETLENDIAALDGEMQGLMSQGEVPTAEHLTEQRSFRDKLWHIIRGIVYPDAISQSEEEPLPSAAEYELTVKAADTTADSRFADVARVSQHAELLKRLTQMRNVIDLEQKRLDAVDKDILELKAQWQLFIEKYCLPALDVVELGEWLSKRNLFLQRYQSYLEVKEQMVSAEERGISFRESLSTALSGAGLPACGEKETLAQVIARIRRIVDQANKAAASQKVLTRKKKSAEEKLTDTERLLEDYKLQFESWKTSWNESMTTIRLSSGAEAEEAAARLEQFDTLEGALDTLNAAKAELETAQATANQIEQEVLRLCEAVGYDRANRPAEAVIETFYERLTEAKELDQRSKTLEDMIREAGKARTQADQALGSAEQALSKLKSVAQCETLEELVEAENRSAEYQKLENEIAAIESRLVTASALPLQELLVQAEGQDIVLVQAALERVIEDLEACTSQVETLHGKLIEKQTALGKVDGEAIAAVAEQRAADATARLSNHVANYTSARLASAILTEVVESYQQRYQGPLLARASELFAAITGGRFIKVATDFDEDMTILVGVRANNKRETVGNLSSGTRDQLFLALRLAAIESHVSSQEPMPIAVDDIVINFDDAAASATFKVLAELSKKTQVLFFTHHEHLIERAVCAIGQESFRTHQL